MTHQSYKTFTSARIVFYVLFLMGLALGMMPMMAYAASGAPNPLYTIEGVEVDVTATSAVEAREKALLEAQVKAYQTLAERVLDADALAGFTLPSADEISYLVQDFEVTNEQLSRVRYKGIFTIRFRPNALKSDMASRGKRVDDVARKPVVVLPFFERDGRLLLWSDPNPWMQAWRSIPSTTQNLRHVTIPLGDSPDVSAIGDDDLTTYDPMQLQSLAARYGADDVAFAVAGFDPQSQGQSLTIDLYSHGFMGARLVDRQNLVRRVGESDPAFLSRAAMDLAGVLKQNWKEGSTSEGTAARQAGLTDYDQAYYPPSSQDTRTASVTKPPQLQPLPYATSNAGGAGQVYPVMARFGSVRDWVQIKSTLERTPGVQAVFVKTLSARAAQIDIRFAGSIGGLQSSLHHQGISLREGYSGQPMDLMLNGAAAVPSVYGQ